MNQPPKKESFNTDKQPDHEPVFPASIDIEPLVALYEAQDPRFEDLLADTAYDFIYENPQFKKEFSANVKVVRSRSASKEDQANAAEKNRRLLDQAKQIILNHAHIEGYIIDEIEHARLQIAHIIEADKAEHGDESDVLTALGILKYDKDQNAYFSYPRKLFPPSTTEKWHTYTTAVKEHIVASDDLKILHGHQRAVENADKTRRYAHNSVAKDVQRLLGFPDTEEGFMEARNLVAKMRENRFPTIETGERDRVTDAVKKGTGKVARFLATHHNELFDPETVNNGPEVSGRHHF